jgi:WD40 repeat protein
MLDGAETVAKGPIVTASLSQDGKHVAYVYEENGKQIAVVDGVTGKPYDQIFFKGHREQCWSSFSPDGKRFAYVALAADKWVMVLDGKESPPYDRIAIVAELGRWGPFFSPDSKHFVYMAQEGLKFSFVFDGAKREDMLEMPVFSPDGAHMAFRAQEGDKNIFYYKKDDKPRPENQEYSDVRSPVFSPDSQHFAHAARSNTGDALIVLDGAETKVEGNIKRIVFSPDSKHVACVTSAKIYVDGAEKWKGDMRDDTLVFSPDSKRFAFIASGGAGFAESWLVIDGSNGQGFADLGFKKRFMNQFKNIPVFSPDSRHAACYRMTLEGSSVVVDGTESKTDLVPLCPPVFDSPTKFHFIGLKGDKEVVLVEAEISEPEKQK